jgi:hypothetical protein
MEYYSGIKNQIMSLEGKWLELQIIILSKKKKKKSESERQIPHIFSHIQKLKMA